MINWTFKYGNRKLDDSDKVLGNYKRDDALYISDFKAIFRDVEQEFFADITIPTIVQVHYTMSQWRDNTTAYAQVARPKIQAWLKWYKMDALIHSVFHELGHVYHYWNQREDYMSRTEYGMEVYAENFTEMCLGSKYKIEHQTYYPAYRGWAERKVYKTDPKKPIQPYSTKVL